MNNDKRCLVTGCSGGIGRAISKRLTEDGWDVIGTCRDPDRLGEQRIDGVTYLPLSLDDDRSIDWLVDRAGPVDALINGAGVSLIGPVEEVPTEKIEHILRVNLIGTIHLTQGVIGSMRTKGRGIIINVSSLAARIPMPFSSAYAASKAGLEAFSYSLRNELHKYGVHVVVVAPGYIQTSHAQDKQFRDDSPYTEDVLRIKRIRDKEIASAPSPSIVADCVSKILVSNSPRPYYGVGEKTEKRARLARLLPLHLIHRIIRKRYDLD